MIMKKTKNPILNKNPEDWTKKEIDFILSGDKKKMTPAEEGIEVASAEADVEETKEGIPETVEKETEPEGTSEETEEETE